MFDETTRKESNNSHIFNSANIVKENKERKMQKK